MADWLNLTFAGIDNWFFVSASNLRAVAGEFFTPFFVFISAFGKGGIFFLVLGALLLLFKKTRRAGLNVLLAVGVGALLTNVIIKNAVARPRPYNASEEYFNMWQAVGAHKEKEFSFPSGHVNVTMTAITALFLNFNKKWSFSLYVFVLLMGGSRIYLTVHYFTDVVGGIVVGGASGVIAYYLTRLVYKGIERAKNTAFGRGFINFDLIELLKRKNSNKQER